MNLKWPHTPRNEYSPWYTILWRVIWIGPAFISRVLFVLSILIMYGPAEADHAWKITA